MIDVEPIQSVLPHVSWAGISKLIAQHKPDHNFMRIAGVRAQTAGGGHFIRIADVENVLYEHTRHGGEASEII